MTDKQEVIGKVIKVFRGPLFRVRIGENKFCYASLSGRMRINHIKVYEGDKVCVSKYLDDNKGIIIRVIK